MSFRIGIYSDTKTCATGEGSAREFDRTPMSSFNNENIAVPWIVLSTECFQFTHCFNRIV
jgi:hypothetical protein